MDSVFWALLGLLLAVVGVEAWLLRRKWRREAAGRLRVQLVEGPTPLEEPKVLGRIGRRGQP